MTETIQQLKEDIAILQEKLRVLEELENHKTPCEIAYKDWWGQYPETGTWDGFDEKRWQGFQAGYNAAYEEKVSEEPQKWNSVHESVKWCEENPDKDPLNYLTPKTPEETEQSMKEAFKKAQQTENWKEIQRLIDEEDSDKNFKNSLDLIEEWGKKNKPSTLYEILWKWWEDIFTSSSDLDANASIDELVNRIDEQFIPPSSERNSYEWNKCLKVMRDKLR